MNYISQSHRNFKLIENSHRGFEKLIEILLFDFWMKLHFCHNQSGREVQYWLEWCSSLNLVLPHIFQRNFSSWTLSTFELHSSIEASAPLGWYPHLSSFKSKSHSSQYYTICPQSIQEYVNFTVFTKFNILKSGRVSKLVLLP